MLSILIPVYNFGISDLIKDLHNQSVESGIQFEIICFDDASDEYYKKQNRSIQNLSNVNYKELPQNIGRSKIRNSLAEASRYDNLLFLDCDSALSSSNFIKKYIIHIENYHVVYGGRIYESNAPLESEKSFRWHYGKKRESFTPEQRSKAPFRSFMTNNFLIKKKAFLSIRLNENIVGYGHEDTMFGIRLKENNVAVKHINNPVVHVGLEDFDEFLDKTLQGLKNLLFISKFVDLLDTVRLYRFLKYADTYGIDNLIMYTEQKLEKRILRNLKGSRPFMPLFDLYKLGHLIKMERDTHRKSS